jgi:serine/threonine-protein kinase
LQADLEAFVREEKLVVSSIALSGFMNEIFADRIDAWRQASDNEKLLAEVLAEKMGGAGTGDRSGSGADVGFLDDSDLEEIDEDGFDETVSSRPTPLPTPTARGEVEPAAEPYSRKRTSPVLLVAALVALVALGVVGVVWVLPALTSSETDTTPETPTHAATSAAEVEAPEPESEPVVSPAPVTGAVEIVTEPEGAIVAVDDAEWHAATPTRIEGLDLGKHTLKVSLDGYREKVVEFAVEEGTAETVKVVLDPVVPPPAAVAKKDDNGKRNPATKRPPRRPGVRKPKVTRPGPKKPPPAAVGGTGTLRIASEPSCEVIVDGKAKGSTPIARIELAAGKHRVQLINSRYGIDRTYSVEIEAGKVTKRRYTFPIE